MSRGSTSDPQTESLVAVSHGTSDPAGQQAITALVNEIRCAATVAVHQSFVDVQEPRASTLLLGLPDKEPHAVLVPLLLSRGVHVEQDLREAAAIRPNTRIALALGPHPSLALVIEHRLVQAGWLPGESVILAGAGTRLAQGVHDCQQVAGLLADLLGVQVTAAFVAAADPSLAVAVLAARTANPRQRVVVASYLLAPGYFQSLVEQCGADLVSAPLLAADAPVPTELVNLALERFTAAQA
ncbi:sirohydrochlorin chelatase [Glutamicibacter arilaitensis]|uniref:sirohydrochlorin chelatase n=1 Tax=Glutamicibacter arilaitensis TaxID=256701 RepID=UPI00384F3058